MNARFARLATLVGVACGQPLAFLLSCAVVLMWAVSGPLFGFSDTWQLVINTSTTIITYLLVFVIQNTQNRDAEAVHLKLDEILRALPEARTALVTERLEHAEQDALERERAELEALARQDP